VEDHNDKTISRRVQEKFDNFEVTKYRTVLDRLD
jgi:hypothetical protein